jgi:hypothetical protein
MEAPGGIFFDEFHNVRIMDTELCKQTEDLQVSTIHSFCSRAFLHVPAGAVRRLPRAHAMLQRQRRRAH